MGKKFEDLNLTVYDPNTSLYYVENVNINYSFKTLETIAKEQGAKLEVGDVLVAQNSNKTRRKYFKKTTKAALILYVQLLDDNEFDPLRKGNGKVKSKGKSIAQYVNL